MHQGREVLFGAIMLNAGPEDEVGAMLLVCSHENCNDSGDEHLRGWLRLGRGPIEHAARVRDYSELVTEVFCWHPVCEHGGVELVADFMERNREHIDRARAKGELLVDAGLGSHIVTSALDHDGAIEEHFALVGRLLLGEPAPPS